MQIPVRGSRIRSIKKAVEETKLEIAANIEMTKMSKAVDVLELESREMVIPSTLPITVDLLEMDHIGVQVEFEGVQTKSSSCSQAVTSLSSWNKQQSGRSSSARGQRFRKTNNAVRHQGKLKPRMQYDRSVRCLLSVISKKPKRWHGKPHVMRSKEYAQKLGSGIQ